MANFFQKIKSYFVKPKPDVIYDTTSSVARSPGSSYIESAPKGTTFVTPPSSGSTTSSSGSSSSSSKKPGSGRGGGSGGGGGGGGSSPSGSAEQLFKPAIEQKPTPKPGDASRLFTGATTKTTPGQYTIPREIGVATVTSEEAKSVPKKYTYWEIQSPSGVKGAVESTTEGVFAGQTSQAISPYNFFGVEFGSSGTRESNVANIAVGQTLAGGAIAYEREANLEIANFKTDYMGFINRPGVEQSDTEIKLTPGFFENLPSYKTYKNMFDESGYVNPAISKQALLYAKEEFISLPPGLRQTLNLGEMGVGASKFGLGLGEVGVNFIGGMGMQTIDLDKKTPTKFSFSDKATPVSPIGRILYAPTVSSKYETGTIPIVGFEYPKEKPIQYLGELITQRPATALPEIATLGLGAIAISSGVGAYSAERALGASRFGAVTTVISELSPLKIRGGIMGVSIDVGKTQQIGGGKMTSSDVGMLNENVRLLELKGGVTTYTPAEVGYTSVRFKGIEGVDISRNTLSLAEYKKFGLGDNLFAMKQTTKGYGNLTGRGNMDVLSYRDTVVSLDKYNLGTTKQLVKSTEFFKGGGNVRLSDFGYIKDATTGTFAPPQGSVKLSQTFDTFFLSKEGISMGKPVMKVSQFGVSGKGYTEEYGYISPGGVSYGRSEFSIKPIERITYTAPYELTSGKVISPGLILEGATFTGKGIAGRPSIGRGTSVGVSKFNIKTDLGNIDYGEMVSKVTSGRRTAMFNYDTLGVSPKDVLKLGYESGTRFEPYKGIKVSRVGGSPSPNYGSGLQLQQVSSSVTNALFTPSKPIINIPKISFAPTTSTYAGLGLYEKTGSGIMGGRLVNPLNIRQSSTSQDFGFNPAMNVKFSTIGNVLSSKDKIMFGVLVTPDTYQRQRTAFAVTPSVISSQKYAMETITEQKPSGTGIPSPFTTYSTSYNFGFDFRTPIGFVFPPLIPSGTYQTKKGRAKSKRKYVRTPSFGAVWKGKELGISQQSFSIGLEETGLFERAWKKGSKTYLPNL